jgi:hypothetical protein
MGTLITLTTAMAASGKREIADHEADISSNSNQTLHSFGTEQQSEYYLLDSDCTSAEDSPAQSCRAAAAAVLL